MSCYYTAFVKEDKDGVDAARGYLAEQMGKSADAPARRKAVEALNNYFVAKGSLRTREVAGIVLIIALETKYPHRGGVIGEIIARMAGLLPPPTATAPSTPK